MRDNTFNVHLNEMGNPLLLTIAQVGYLLNLGKTKTYELVMSNQIKSIKLGRKRLVRRSELEKYVSELGGELDDD